MKKNIVIKNRNLVADSTQSLGFQNRRYIVVINENFYKVFKNDWSARVYINKIRHLECYEVYQIKENLKLEAMQWNPCRNEWSTCGSESFNFEY